MLSRNLPASIQVIWVKYPRAPFHDAFLGNVAPPSIYGFNLLAGVSEPQLLLRTSTAFSWGTKFEQWGAQHRSWVQCFHLPLPVLGGVLFHHYLARLGIDGLQPFLVSAVAAQKGVFAHPNANGNLRLARAEYGYQFDASSFQQPFAASAAETKVTVIPAEISTVEKNGNGIAALHLSNGQIVSADLYVDCTGPQAQLLSSLGSTSQGERRMCALSSLRPMNGPLGAPCRTLTAHSFGWQSDTPLQGATVRTTVFSPESESQALLAHGEAPAQSFEVTLGSHPQAWVDNCVAISHASSVLEPLTQAPMLILQRHIETLAALIPCSSNMAVERREFNRKAAEDYTHAELFNRALFETQLPSNAPYWSAAGAEPLNEKLAQKLTQFESRGVLVAFDLEPFNPEDWIILHDGIGRRPARYDRVADRTAETEIRQYLANMRNEIELLVKAIPKHDEYMKGLVRYLKQKEW